jgi:hypothetical protein
MLRNVVRLALGVALLIAGACGSTPLRIPMRSPNPNGCYVMLFEGRGFESYADVLNGPNKWARLEGLKETNYASWADRIRSLRVGAAATVTAFTEPGFRGSNEQYRPESQHADLSPEISANIESLEIACVRPPEPQR